MKVILYGHIKPKSLKCVGCGALLEYVPKDVKNRSNLIDDFQYIRCPVCGKTLYVGEKKGGGSDV